MITLASLTSSEELAEDLAWPFDFDVTMAGDDHSWIALNPETPFVVIAGDGAGGVFLVYGSGADTEVLPILHATSEGQAGRLAANLTEFLALLMAVPNWRDLLKFSGGGDLAEMRRTASSWNASTERSSPTFPRPASELRTH